MNPTVAWPYPDTSTALFFDSQRGVLTAVGSRTTTMYQAEWDGGPAWRPITPLSTPLSTAYSQSAHHMTYDPVLGRAYTGLYIPTMSFEEQWEYGTVSIAQFQATGAGCAGTLGEPELRLTKNWTRAWLGQSLSVDVINLPQSTGFLALGWSDTQAGAIALPLSLTPFGMPGCAARVSFDAVYALTGGGQTATQQIPVPNLAGLLGAVIHQQAFAIDPTANAAGLTASNAVRLTVGRL
ncbi:MAG: hypothetical protein IPK26_03995 [Planctomycetes bacterium]|nr:hypothetical protein [Planctomycetota bacterium]